MVTRISNIYEPQIPVVSADIPCPAARDVVVSRVGVVWPMETATLRSVVVRKNVRLSCSDSEESDDDVLSVGAVRPLATVAPLGGAGLIDDCQSHVDSNDDVLSVGTWAPMNRPAMCCARLDDFDWVVPDYDPDILLSGRDIGVGVTDLTEDIQVFCRTCFRQCLTRRLLCCCPCLWSLIQDHRLILGGRPLRRRSPSLMR